MASRRCLPSRASSTLVGLCGLVAAFAFVACSGSEPGQRGAEGHNSRPVLKATLGIDLAQVSAFAVLAKDDGAALTRANALTTGGRIEQAVDGEAAGGAQLFALTLVGEALEVTLVEEGNPLAPGQVVEQPHIQFIVPTATWVLFSTPGFGLNLPAPDGSPSSYPTGCGLIAARRSDGALFCAPLFANNGADGQAVENTILANEAGDVVYMMAALSEEQGRVLDGSHRLYKVQLDVAAGPTATAAIDGAVAGLHTFRVNAAGDLYVNYFASSMDAVSTTRILPVDGGASFSIPGTRNAYAVPGEAGAVDRDDFYVRGGGGIEEATLRVVRKSGGIFTETVQTLSISEPEAFFGMYRLGDGVYMFNQTRMTLARVIANAAVITSPTTKALVDIERIVRVDGSTTMSSRPGRLVFIAEGSAGYKFVRHDGATQQDIPIEAGLDVSSFTVSGSGAIDFMGLRVATQEKVRGSIAADATVAVIESTGVLDPAHVVVFTRIN